LVSVEVARTKTFTEILLEASRPAAASICPRTPELDPKDLAAMRGMSYRELAFAVLCRFADDIPPPI